MQTIILCGGRGIRLYNEANYIPKAMVHIGHKPMIWHVMKRYALYNHTEFILALGTKGDLIRNYFLQYELYSNDLSISLGNREVNVLTNTSEEKWKMIVTDTGDSAQSGARIARCRNFITDTTFMVSYSDSVADIDVEQLVHFHKKMGKIATITGVHPPYRDVEITVKHNLATGLYDGKTSEGSERFINGGYMVFEKKIFNFLNQYNECRLESDIFPELIKKKEMAIYPHHGFWRWLDTDRDYVYLSELASTNRMHWLQSGG